ncbi:hypothetical protein OG225_22200 [Nocardia sp. NBC_01377]|uniref:alcohol dehydrogenase catalytic domain-containing protein n=1 Tax=Nocardia sp. NBC_01377 TaxID=2903595 RepID=UPI00324DCFCD
MLYPEIALRSGTFPLAAEPPQIFGFQAVGVVTDTGPDVDTDLIGQRVAVATTGFGAYAEYVCAPAVSATPIPQSLSATEAAAVLMSGSVAITLLDAAACSATASSPAHRPGSLPPTSSPADSPSSAAPDRTGSRSSPPTARGRWNSPRAAISIPWSNPYCRWNAPTRRIG